MIMIKILMMIIIDNDFVCGVDGMIIMVISLYLLQSESKLCKKNLMFVLSCLTHVHSCGGLDNIQEHSLVVKKNIQSKPSLLCAKFGSLFQMSQN